MGCCERGNRLPCCPVELHGSIIANITAAVPSVERLRGHPVYNGALESWQDLLAHARAEKRANLVEQGTVDHLVARPQSELADRGAG